VAELAIRPMTLDEFLRWDDGTDTRYELIGGFPVAMAPPAQAHRMLAAHLVTRLENILAGRRPCNARTEAGVIRSDRADSFFVADVAVSSVPDEPGRRAIRDPIPLIEILSPSTERHDRRVKLPAYQRVDSLQEIALVDRDTAYAELYRRRGDFWVVEYVDSALQVLALTSVGREIPMSELYDGIAIPGETGT
jgi:Uma2 family endonuclease